MASLEQTKMKSKAVRNLPWFSFLGAFFHLPNPRIFTLFLISTSATFFLGVAMIVDWAAYGHRHQGYGWIAYYAPVIIVLPLVAWTICLAFAFIFFKDRIQTKPRLASPPKSSPLQPERRKKVREEPQLLQEQTKPTNHNETVSAIVVRQDSSVIQPPLAVPEDGQKAVDLANDPEEIVAESSECMTKKTNEELGLMVGHENNHHDRVNNEETQRNESTPEIRLAIQQKDNNTVPHRSRGKSQDDSICNLAFSLPLCYTPSLRHKRNLSL